MTQINSSYEVLRDSGRRAEYERSRGWNNASASSAQQAQREAQARREPEQRRAIRDFDEVIRLDPQSTLAFSNRGVAYDSLGQYERAIRDYDEAVRLDPQYAEAYSNRGYTDEAMGKSEEAERDFAKAKELGYP